MAEHMREKVREKYAELAVANRRGEDASCCGPSCGCGEASGEALGTQTAVRVSDLSRKSYSAKEVDELPEEAVGASLGCGNPVALDAIPGRGCARPG